MRNFFTRRKYVRRLNESHYNYFAFECPLAEREVRFYLNEIDEGTGRVREKAEEKGGGQTGLRKLPRRFLFRLVVGISFLFGTIHPSIGTCTQLEHLSFSRG